MGNIGNKAPAVKTAKEEVRRTTGALHGTAEKELRWIAVLVLFMEQPRKS